VTEKRMVVSFFPASKKYEWSECIKYPAGTCNMKCQQSTKSYCAPNVSVSHWIATWRRGSRLRQH
jgi:hypothetical protein